MKQKALEQQKVQEESNARLQEAMPIEEEEEEEEEEEVRWGGDHWNDQFYCDFRIVKLTPGTFKMMSGIK
jgi:hypothetical protein